MGLALETVELLGQDPEAARAFVLHARHGMAAAFLRALDEDPLRATLLTRERYADRLRLRDVQFVAFM